MSLVDAKTITEAGGKVLSGTSKFMDSLLNIRPGLAIASEARGVARASTIMLNTIEETIARCRKMGFPQETTDAMCVMVANEFGKSGNLSSCLSFARDAVGDDFDASGIDHSWFLKWSGHASEQSDDEMRRIWGQLLSGELEQPGSFSKRTMSILSDMSGAEARSFRHLCGVCIKRRLDGRKPQMIYYPFNIPNELALEPQEADSLRALGLTTLSGSNGVMSAMSIRFSDKPTILKIGKCAYSVTSEHACSIEVASDPLTSYGQELSTLCDIGTYDGFEQYVMGILEKLEVDVTRVEGQTE